MNAPIWTGRWLALVTSLTMALFALNSLLCRLAVTQGMDSHSYTCLRTVSAAAFLSAWALRQGHNPLAGGNGRSAFFLFAYMALFSLAYASLSAATGVLILVLGIQTISLGAAHYIGEPPTARQAGGIALALAGLAVLLQPGLTRPPLVAAAVMFLSGGAWALYTVCIRRNGTASCTAGNFLRAAPLALALLFLPGTRHCPPAAVAVAILAGVAASGLGYALWDLISPRLGVTRSAAVQLSTPVITAVVGVFLLNEPLSQRQIVAAGCILGGIALGIRNPGQ